MVRVTVRDMAGNIIERSDHKNLITNLAFDLFTDSLLGVVTADEWEIKYIGVGDDNTAPALTDTTLGNEVFRKALTSSDNPATGQASTTFYISPDEAVGQIEELGWFCGPLAGAGADSGTMIARLLYSRNKTALESIQVDRLDEITEV
jgi:hypothetical protein